MGVEPTEKINAVSLFSMQPNRESYGGIDASVTQHGAGPPSFEVSQLALPAGADHRLNSAFDLLVSGIAVCHWDRSSVCYPDP